MKVAAIARAGRRCLAAAVVGLVAHAALYRSLWPNDNVHGYLGWYTLIVAVVSLVAIAGLVVALAFALRARRRGRPVPALGAVWSRADATASTSPTSPISGLVWVYLQETFEQASQTGSSSSPPSVPARCWDCSSASPPGHSSSVS